MQKLFTTILLAAVFFTSQLLFAETVRFKSEGDGVLYATLAQNSDSYIVLISKEFPGKLPQLIERREFQTHAGASHYFQDVSQNWQDAILQPQSQILALEEENETLWTVTNQWNKEWELRYADWVKADVTPDFFRDTLATDCADVIYATRWIFARNNGLPMVNRLGGSGLLFGHFSMRKEWKNKRTNSIWFKDQRFMAALNYLLALTYTGALARDSYPIRIDSNSLLPGSHFTYLSGETGHNYLITAVRNGKDGRLPISVSYSTTPKEYRTLAVGDFSDPKQPQDGGFMRFRWPEETSPGVWRLSASEAMPGYSLEQYQPEFVANDSFDEAVFNRVAPQRTVDFKRKVTSLLYTLVNRYSERVQLVEGALRACFPNRCAPESREYDDYSTPSRDKRIQELIDFTAKIVSERPETKWTYNLFVWNNKINLGGPQYQTYEPALAELIKIWNERRYSSDPNDSIEKRWGIR